MSSPPKLQSDACASIRAELDDNQADILSVEESLSDHDIPESIKRGLRTLLERLKQRRRGLLRALTACEARPARPAGALATQRVQADRSDRCAGIAEQLDRVDDEFFAATQELAQPDIAPERRAELEAVVARCRSMQRLLLQALATCQEPPEPLEP